MPDLTPTWIAASDRIVGESHPLFPDSVNSGVISLNTAMLVAHEQTGFHTARRTGLVGEIGSFSGNGAARVITLTNTGLTPKKVIAWQLTGSGSGGNVVSNGDFETDTTGWTGNDCTLSQVGSGGQSGGYMGALYTGAGATFYAYATISVVNGGTYTTSAYFRTQSGGTTTGRLYIGTSPGTGGTLIDSASTTGSWQQLSGGFTASAATMYITLSCSIASVTQPYTLEWDTVRVNQTITGSAPEFVTGFPTNNAIDGRTTGNLDTGLISAITTGSFSVGTSTLLNATGENNYYLVLGIDEDTDVTGDAGAGADPTWIPSGTAYTMIANGTGTVSSENYGNNVVSEIWTLFLHEHANTGAHSITLQDKRIETISWSGNDADDRVISLALTDLDITDIEVYRDSMPVASKSTDMAGDTTKDESAAAFAADLIQDITTNGQFTVGTGLNASGNTYIAIVIGV